ncbi:SAM-dependent methyltransferase [Planctomycetota bacterium]
MKISENVPGSFRDPSGFLFCRNGSIYRQINMDYIENYDLLMNSGLYESLVNTGLLIEHEEVDIVGPRPNIAHRIIKPECIPFISYPYEWSFSQLKDAAEATLQIQKKSLDLGMSLKDCSAYNIQFRKGKPVLIDTLSFEKYRDNQPWIAYRQFCQHFLAPLALMCYKDVRLNQLLRIYIDGIPLDLASSLLPARTWLKLSLLSHIHLHAKSQRHYAHKPIKKGSHRITLLSFRGLIDNLESTIRRMDWEPKDTEWADYYDDTTYSQHAFLHKKQLVTEFIETVKPTNVWDIGANVGLFSRIVSDKEIQTISLDSDPAAVEKNYLELKKRNDEHILPLLIDLTNPSSGIGWENQERMSLVDRGPVDMVMALALIHHLAISNNVPFDKIAGFLRGICNWLIIEFVPKSDPRVQQLLSTRKDIFPDYDESVFENELGQFFTIQRSVKIRNSERTLYLMKAKENPA